MYKKQDGRDGWAVEERGFKVKDEAFFNNAVATTSGGKRS
jgi:hypothetical protein